MITIAALFLLVAFVLFHNFFWKRRGLPPGPMPLPLFGNTLTLARLAPGYSALQQWTKQYGPVYTYWLGEVAIVAVTDYQLMRETFIRDGDSYSGRDLFNEGFKHLRDFSDGIKGVVRTQGDEWRQLRRFSLRVMRQLGMSKHASEAMIMQEVETLLASLDDGIRKGVQEHDVYALVDVAVGSVITQLLFGHRFVDDSREDFFRLKHLMGEEVHMMSGSVCRVVMMNPALRHLWPFSEAFARFDDNIHAQFDFFDRQIERLLRAREDGRGQDAPPSTFVEAFLLEIGSMAAKGDAAEREIFSTSSLRALCFELYGAGQETTSNTLNFLILYLLLDQRVQGKMQRELDALLAREGRRRVAVGDRAHLPYTNAVIQEGQRCCNLIPQNLPHKTTRDVVVGGHCLAEGTIIVPQISCVLYDEKAFPEPHSFLPERFIDEQGQLKKCEELVPFSVGKRQCLGEPLARMELFLVATNLFYAYKLSPVDPARPPTTQKLDGLTVSPVHYKCRVERRH